MAGDEDHEAATPLLRPDPKRNNTACPLPLLSSIALMAGGATGGTLLLRLDSPPDLRPTLTATLHHAGFPLLFLPLLFSYFRRPRSNSSPFLISPKLSLAGAGVGALAGLGSVLLPVGSSCIPASATDFALSAQLGVTAVFAFFLLRQYRLEPYALNSVVLLTVGPVALGLRDGGRDGAVDVVGLFLVLGSVVVLGFLLPVIERVYVDMRDSGMAYAAALQFQLAVAASATVFSVAGMFVTDNLEAISRQAEGYEKGRGIYYLKLIAIATFLQLFFIGGQAVIFYDSALLCAACLSLLLPVVLLHWFTAKSSPLIYVSRCFCACGVSPPTFMENIRWGDMERRVKVMILIKT